MTRLNEIPTDCATTDVRYGTDTEPDTQQARHKRFGCIHPVGCERCAWCGFTAPPPTTMERIDSVIAAMQQAREAHRHVLAFSVEGPSGDVGRQRATVDFCARIASAETRLRGINETTASGILGTPARRDDPTDGLCQSSGIAQRQMVDQIIAATATLRPEPYFLTAFLPERKEYSPTGRELGIDLGSAKGSIGVEVVFHETDDGKVVVDSHRVLPESSQWGASIAEQLAPLQRAFLPDRKEHSPTRSPYANLDAAIVRANTQLISENVWLSRQRHIISAALLGSASGREIAEAYANDTDPWAPLNMSIGRGVDRWLATTDADETLKRILRHPIVGAAMKQLRDTGGLRTNKPYPGAVVEPHGDGLGAPISEALLGTHDDYATRLNLPATLSRLNEWGFWCPDHGTLRTAFEMRWCPKCSPEGRLTDNSKCQRCNNPAQQMNGSAYQDAGPWCGACLKRSRSTAQSAPATTRDPIWRSEQTDSIGTDGDTAIRILAGCPTGQHWDCVGRGRYHPPVEAK